MGRVLAASEAGEHVGREGPGLRVRGERGLDPQAGEHVEGQAWLPSAWYLGF